MGLLDSLFSPLRSVLGASGRVEADVMRHAPMAGPLAVESRLEEAVTAIHRAADSMERHVEVVETLASSVPALTESVNRLVGELNGLLGVLAPMAAAEREVSRIEHLFGRRRHAPPPAPPPAEP